VDITLRKQKVMRNLELKLSARNIFDEDVLEPSPGPIASIPGVFPMAGRSIYGEVAYSI